MIAAELANLSRGANQHTGASANLPNLLGETEKPAPVSTPITQAAAAAMLNVSTRSVTAANAMHNGGPPLDDESLFGGPDHPIGLGNIRYLAAVPQPPWPPVELSPEGARLRDFLRRWVGASAADAEIAAGLDRLADMVAHGARIGPPWREGARLFTRVALCSIGIAPADNPELESDEALFAWLRTLISGDASEIVAAMSGAISWP